MEISIKKNVQIYLLSQRDQVDDIHNSCKPFYNPLFNKSTLLEVCFKIISEAQRSQHLWQSQSFCFAFLLFLFLVMYKEANVLQFILETLMVSKIFQMIATSKIRHFLLIYL